ncbi:hypothetical protein D3C76_813030 [compost metagenome]
MTDILVFNVIKFNIEDIKYADTLAITAPYIFISFIETKVLVITILITHPMNKLITGNIYFPIPCNMAVVVCAKIINGIDIERYFNIS